METEKKPLRSRIESVVLAFVIAYGIHYLGYFLRKRYFDFLGTLQIDEGISHCLDYLGHVIFLAILLLYALAIKNDRKYILDFIPKKGKKDLLWLLLGAVTGFVAMGICVLSAHLHGDITIVKGSGSGAGVFIFAFIAVFIQASAEEFESRAFLFGKMKGDGVSLIAATLVSAFFFSYLHSTNPGFGFVPFLSIFIIGVQYALSYHYFGNIWFTCGAHTLWNFTQDFIVGLPDSGKPAVVSIFNTNVNGSSFFYDSQFGIEGGWMAICLNTVICVIIFLIGRKYSQKKNNTTQESE